MDYMKDLEIDRYNLEEELIKQPQLYMQWAIEATNAADEASRAKTRLELIKAKVDKRIRDNPEHYGIDDKRITEGAIKSIIAQNSKVKRYTKKYLEAFKNERILNEAKNAFQHRKKMLEALVNLNIQLHFAEPKVPGISRDELSHREKKKQIVDALKRRGIKRRR